MPNQDLQSAKPLANSSSLYWTAGCLLLLGALAVVWLKLPHPLLVVAFGILPLMGIVVLRQAFWMVLAFVLFSFFRLHEAYPALYPLRLPQLLALASLASLAWSCFALGRLKVYWTREMSLLCAFAFWVLIGCILATSRGTAMAYFNGVFSKIILMTLAIAWLVTSSRALSITAFACMLAGLAIAYVALRNAQLGLEMVEGTRVTIGRSFGSVLGDPNDLALTLMFPLGFSLAWSANKGLGWPRLIAIIASVALIMALLATQSRGGLLGISTIGLVLLWRRFNNKWLLVSLLVLCLPVLFAVAGISERSSGGAAESGIDESSMGRLYAWQAAFNMALANPLTGVGIDNFYANYYFFSSHWDGKNHAVHSTWFGILAETGFVGLSLFCLLLWRITKIARDNLHQAQAWKACPPRLFATLEGIFAGLLGSMVAGTFLTQGFTWPFYIFTALVIAAQRLLACKMQNPANSNT